MADSAPARLATMRADGAWLGSLEISILLILFESTPSSITQGAMLFLIAKGTCAEINIKVRPVSSLAAIALPCAVTLSIDPITSLMLFAGAIVNGSIWSQFHSEMHRPRSPSR